MATQPEQGAATTPKVTRSRKAATGPGIAPKAVRTRKATTGPASATKPSRPRKPVVEKAVRAEAKATSKPAARTPPSVPVAELIEAPAPVAERLAPKVAEPALASYMADEVPLRVTAPPRRLRLSRLFSWLGPVRKTPSSAAG